MMTGLQNGAISLPELLVEFTLEAPAPAVDIMNVSSNSKDVTPGTLFIALSGINSKGIDYAIDAVNAGAIAVLFDADDPYSRERIPLLQKQISTHWIGVSGLIRANGFIVSRFFGEPAKAMTIVGVTGTDGKSSVTHLLFQALTRLGKSSASIGTLGYGIGNQLSPGSLTTPDAVTLQSRLHQFSQQRCEYVVMEVSSHALQQYRVNGCNFDIAVLTNLGRDHLDYHGDLESYAEAKARLFKDFDLSARIVNADDDFGRRLAADSEADSLFRYSISGSEQNANEVSLISIEQSANGQNIRARTPVGDVTAVTGLIGHFNVLNTLACIATLVALGFNRDQLETAIKDLKPIPGRMEMFSAGSDQAVAVVDFAHTEQALRACLEACRGHTSGELWCVFGCGGDRDPGKRAGMGRAVEELADHAIVTDDNPRHESPEKIVAGVLLGMQDPDRASVVHNRKAAIEYALSEAAAGDMVVITGKGHEPDQIVGDERRPFSDRYIVGQILGVSHD